MSNIHEQGFIDGYNAVLEKVASKLETAKRVGKYVAPLAFGAAGGGALGHSEGKAYAKRTIKKHYPGPIQTLQEAYDLQRGGKVLVEDLEKVSVFRRLAVGAGIGYAGGHVYGKAKEFKRTGEKYRKEATPKVKAELMSQVQPLRKSKSNIRQAFHKTTIRIMKSKNMSYDEAKTYVNTHLSKQPDWQSRYGMHKS